MCESFRGWGAASYLQARPFLLGILSAILIGLSTSYFALFSFRTNSTRIEKLNDMELPLLTGDHHQVDLGLVICGTQANLRQVFPVRLDKSFELGRVVVSSTCCVALKIDTKEIASGERYLEACLSVRLGNGVGRKRWFGLAYAKSEDSAPYSFELTAHVLPRADTQIDGKCLPIRVEPGKNLKVLGSLIEHYSDDASFERPTTKGSEGVTALLANATNVTNLGKGIRRLTTPFELTISPPNDVQAGNQEAAIDFSWQEAAISTRMPIQYEVLAPIISEPRVLVFNTAEPLEQVVRLASRNREILSIVAIATPIPGILTSTKTESGCTVDIAISVDPLVLARSANVQRFFKLKATTNLGSIEIPIAFVSSKSGKQNENIK